MNVKASFLFLPALMLTWTAQAANNTFDNPRAWKNDDLLVIKVRLETEAPAGLTESNIAAADFPQGKSVAITVNGGGKDLRVNDVAYYGKFGFKTTVFANAGAKPEEVAALEKAGAEIAMGSMWGAKQTKGSRIGGNTRDSAYHAVGSSRLAMKEKAKGPVHIVSAATFHAGKSFLYTRMGAEGYGHVVQDCNFMVNSGTNAVILARGDSPKTQEFYTHAAIAGAKAHELIAFQTLNNQLRGMLARRQKGQVIEVAVWQDLDEKGRERFEDLIAPWGKHEDLWHATLGEIFGVNYLREKSRILEVKQASEKVHEIAIGLEPDIFPDFLLAPLPLKLPKAAGIASATVSGVPCTLTARDDAIFLDVPVQAALRNGLKMRLVWAQPCMEIPDTMQGELTLENASQAPLEALRFSWRVAGHPNMEVAGGPESEVTLAPGAAQKFPVTVSAKRGALFGIRPIEGVALARAGGEERTFVEGFEVVLKPRLECEVDPKEGFPMHKGGEQYYLVHLCNHKSSKEDGPPDRFLSPKSGACKGVVRLELPEGMSAEPAEQPFELAARDQKTLLFKLRNDAWSPKLEMVRPRVQLEGEAEPMEILYPGTPILRDQEMIGYTPLNDEGLMLHANWDDPDNWKNEAVNPRNHKGTGGFKLHHEGLKGYCIKYGSYAFFDPYKLSDYREGTVLFWIHRDNEMRNENQVRPKRDQTWKIETHAGYFPGEFLGGEDPSGGQKWKETTWADSASGIGFRRWPGWGGEEGYLELVYQCMMQKRHYVQVDYKKEWLWEWHQVGFLWHAAERRLEIYIDGKLAGKADPGEGPWMPSPWNKGRPGGGSENGFGFGSTDHGKKTWMMKDELYIYCKALTPEQIKANYEKHLPYLKKP